VRGDKTAEQLGGEEWRVARDDQHVAAEARERWQRTADGVASAQLVWLDDGLGVTHDGGHRLGGVRRHDHDDALGAGLADRAEHPAEQRPTPDRVQHLRQFRAHTGALAPGHDDAGERSIGGAGDGRHPGLQH
jgi:hypothetical protein